MAKQTRITIETHSVLILQSRNTRRAWCQLCAAEAEMIALENLDATPKLDRPALQAWLDSADLHRHRAADGAELICLNSLLACVGKTKSALPRLCGSDTYKETS